MFFRTWRVMRRTQAQGASLRLQHAILGEPPLSSTQLVEQAKSAFLDDTFATEYDYSPFIEGFLGGYTQAEVRIHLPLMIVTIRDAIRMEYLSTHCECRARLKTQEERDMGYCSKCGPVIAQAIGEQRRINEQQKGRSS